MKIAYMIIGLMLLAMLAGCGSEKVQQQSTTTEQSEGLSAQEDANLDQQFISDSEEVEIGEMV